MTVSLFVRQCVLGLGLVLALSGCEHLPADMDRADAAAKAGNYALAVQEWQTLADYGYPEAKLRLAQAYIKGNGVEKDPAMAAQLLEPLAAEGNPNILLQLGQLYEKGQGVDKNLEKAEMLYLKAAAQKHPRGMLTLARFYERQKQPEKAQIFYKGAAALGVDAAKDKLAQD